jgi:DNA-binding winged helix-turn-helix (wHTH) protein/tetratricopeptide (TPR) repeat protein
VKVRFGEFVLDREAGRLEGPAGEVRLRPQAYRMLEVLIESAPRILSQEELLDRVWGVEHLSPASVKQAVSEVRQALGDDPARPSIVETVHRRGYRFIAPVAPAALEAVAVAEPASPAAPRRPGRRAAALLAILALAGLSVLGLVGRPHPAPPEPAAIRPSRLKVAVVGFKNLSGDPEAAWISGALVEILGFELAAPGRVRVVPAESVAWMKRELSLPGAESQSPESLAAIRRNLGAGIVVGGSYLLTGTGLRLQVLAQDVATGETVAWARETGPPEELISLATSAARGLHGTLAGDRGSGPPLEAAALASNAESLRLLSEALAHLRVRDAPAALPRLERAAALDPGNPFLEDAFAAAYARLGFDARSREAAGRAVELSAGLPREVRLAIEGRSREVRGEWPEAEAIYRDLFRLHPDDLEAGLRLAAAQKSAGHGAAARETVAALRRLPPPEGSDPRIELMEGDIAWQAGDFSHAGEAATRAIAEAERRGATLLVAEGRFARGWSHHRLGEGDAARVDFHAARVLFERLGDRGAAAGTLVASAVALQAGGRPAEARQAYEAALPVLREIGDRTREAKALNNFAALLGEEGDLDGVTPLLERSLAIKRETGDLHGAATTLSNLGNLLRGRGDLKGARRRIDEALEIHRGLGDAFGTAFTLRGLSRLLAREDRPGEALAALEEALALSRGIGDAEGAAEALLALGDLARQAGRAAKARESYGEALTEFRRLGQASSVAYVRMNLAELDLDQEKLADARAGCAEVLTLAEKLRNPLLEAHARHGLGRIAEKQGDKARARVQFEKSLALFQKLGDRDAAAQNRQALARLDGT